MQGLEYWHGWFSSSHRIREQRSESSLFLSLTHSFLCGVQCSGCSGTEKGQLFNQLSLQLGVFFALRRSKRRVRMLLLLLRRRRRRFFVRMIRFQPGIVDCLLLLSLLVVQPGLLCNGPKQLFADRLESCIWRCLLVQKLQATVRTKAAIILGGVEYL